MTPSTVLLHMAWAQLWQVTLLILVVGGLSHKISRKRPHLAFVLWASVIVKCFMPPIWSCPTGVFSWAQLESYNTPPIADRMPLLVTEFGSEAPAAMATAAAGPAVPGKGSEVVSAGGPVVATASFSPWKTLLAIWLTGVVLLAGLAVRGWCRCRRILRASRVPTPPWLASLAAAVACRIALRRACEIVVTTQRITPCVFGVLKPIVVVPQSLLWDRAPQDVEPILAHELIHVRRGDTVFSLLQVAAQIIWWFHPLVWWANRQATRVTESCCDVEVLAALNCQRATYAKCLIDALEGGRAMAAACPGLRPTEITSRRLEDIMRLTRNFNSRTRLWCLVTAIITAIVVLPGAGFAVGGADESNADSAPSGEEGREHAAPTGNRGAWQTADHGLFPSPVDEATQAEEIRFVAFAQGGALVACAKYGGSIELRDARSGQLKSTLAVGNYPRAICGTIDGDTLAVLTGSEPAEVQFWDLSAGTLQKIVRFEPTDHQFHRASFARSGQAVIVDEEETFSVWDTNTGAMKMRNKPQITAEFVAANVRRLNDAHANWKARHPEEAARSPCPVNEHLTPADCRIRVGEVDLSPDGEVAATAFGVYDERNSGIHCAIQLWDVSAGKLKGTLENGNRGAYSMCFSDSGRLLAVGESGSVAIWDVPSGEFLERIESEGMVVFAIAMSPDEQELVGCGDGRRKEFRSMYTVIGETKIWNRRTGLIARTISGGWGRGFSVDFSPDGKWIVRTDHSTVLAHVAGGQEHWLKACGIWGETVHQECRRVVAYPK